ncbi:MAG TPA: A/G-specific adenine glycosylase, partial [Methanomicrobiales archaeon]|nr:A/G-specific adenine glycosylase [Methanomicrobiales archaeon]
MAQGEKLTGELAALEETVRAGAAEKGLTPGVVRRFQKLISLFYATRGRDLPWRRTTDPYCILVSEFMLQQTQVARVLDKYPGFLARFPDVATLAAAPKQEVLRAWQGLGYNRRALALLETARAVVERYQGSIPLDKSSLDSLPGIGNATAGAIVVFSTNRPEVFIETNIRRVYIHLFFPDSPKVSDREIEPLLEKTLVRKNPRGFYYALMDYGVFLKKTRANPNMRSATYTRQGPFQGSDRQVRGTILRLLLARGEIGRDELRTQIPVDSSRLDRILDGLE